MKKYLKRSLLVLLSAGMSFSTLACNKYNHAEVSNADNIKITETNALEIDTDAGNEIVYNKSKTLAENADIQNNILETKYGKSFKISTEEDYVKSEKTDWTLVLKDNRVGIDTSTWKFDYDSNSDDSKYMDAVLTSLTFFCGEEMGKSLWQLTGDLLDGGADETQYGFEHNGSQVVYKNGNAAVYESGSDKSTMYLWVTPCEY